MNRKIISYIILSFGLVMLWIKPATCDEPLSKKLGLRVNTIMIDPGYGGTEKGPKIDKRYGKDITLDIAQRLQHFLEISGFTAYLTRTGDRLVPLEDRVFQGQSKGANVHLAISVSKTKKYCIRLFVASPPIKETPKKPATRQGDELNSELVAILANLKASSIREDSLSLAGNIRGKLRNSSISTCIELWKGKNYILKNAEMPTVIVDLPISSSPNTQTYLTDDNSLQYIAQSLAGAVKEYSDERTPKEEKAN